MDFLLALQNSGHSLGAWQSLLLLVLVQVLLLLLTLLSSQPLSAHKSEPPRLPPSLSRLLSWSSTSSSHSSAFFSTTTGQEIGAAAAGIVSLKSWAKSASSIRIELVQELAAPNYKIEQAEQTSVQAQQERETASEEQSIQRS